MTVNFEESGVPDRPPKVTSDGESADRDRFKSRLGHRHRDSGILTQAQWDEIMKQYPIFGTDRLAVPNPTWESLDFHADPKGVDRAILRHRARRVDSLFLDSQVEMLGFTEPEIRQLLGGSHIKGRTEAEEQRMRDMGRANELVEEWALKQSLEPSLDLAGDLALRVNASVPLPYMGYRGEQDVLTRGPRVGLGEQQRFQSLDSRVLDIVFEQGTLRISQISHPVVRGATWAAFVAYQQPFFDGNKRIGRYSMNAVAMSHGYDALLIPASRKDEYIDEVVGALRTGDLTSHIRFLLGLYEGG